MKKRKWRKAAWALLALGIALSVAALIPLATARDVLQYAVVAPSGENAADQIRQLMDARKAIGEALIDCTSVSTMGGMTAKASVSGGGKNGTATVYAVSEGWFEVYPVALAGGRLLTETELRRGDKVALLDSELAFSLFGSELPEDAEATIGGETYRVVGTVRHRRGVGEVTEHCAYLPLEADAAQAMDAIVYSAVPIPNSGARTMFEKTLRGAWGENGSFYSLEKEAMRRTMVLRLPLLVFGMSAILALFRRMSALMSRKIAAFREGMRWNYIKSMVPKLLAIIVLALLGYGVLLALLYALMTYSIRPLYVFTEWVPENIVEWSSISAVFWNLVSAAAQPVKIGTREMRTLEFWGAILRWGAFCILWAGLLVRRKAQS